jgi:hypothetical protein
LPAKTRRPEQAQYLCIVYRVDGKRERTEVFRSQNRALYWQTAFASFAGALAHLAGSPGDHRTTTKLLSEDARAG